MPIAFLITGLITAFLFGIVVGSFLNVCIYRLPLGKSLLAPPSHCPSCNTRLRPADLIPLVSFLALKRQCRYCHQRISWRYFTIEAITGLLFVACWWSLGARFGIEVASPLGWVAVIAMWVFASAMLVTFVIDMDTTYVFEPVTWVAMLAGIVFEIVTKIMSNVPIAYSIGSITIPYLPEAVPGMIVGFLVFVAMNGFGWLIFRKPGMGLGDSYIGAAIGAMLGVKAALLSFGIAVMIGALCGVVILILDRFFAKPQPAEKPKKSAAMEEEDDMPEGRYMPFGPFLTAAAMLVALAPAWFLEQFARLAFWWLHQSPFVG